MKNIPFICQAAIIASLYAILTIVFLPISFGAIQCRVSEALTLLPAILPAAVPGVTLGCLISNILGGAAMPDIIFGTLATFIGAVLSYHLSRPYRNKIVVHFNDTLDTSFTSKDINAKSDQSINKEPFTGKDRKLIKERDLEGDFSPSTAVRIKATLPPVISNAIIVPLVLKYAYMLGDAYLFLVFTVGAGEIISVGILGNILLSFLCRKNVLRYLCSIHAL